MQQYAEEWSKIVDIPRIFADVPRFTAMLLHFAPFCSTFDSFLSLFSILSWLVFDSFCFLNRFVIRFWVVLWLAPADMIFSSRFDFCFFPWIAFFQLIVLTGRFFESFFSFYHKQLCVGVAESQHYCYCSNILYQVVPALAGSEVSKKGHGL